tara:strand:+ start:1878 stop:2018 length:141 start_codon:yes stop_codon:yes gene_type:complete
MNGSTQVGRQVPRSSRVPPRAGWIPTSLTGHRFDPTTRSCALPATE